MTEPLICPICGKRPTVAQAQPWPRKNDTDPWYVGCIGHIDIDRGITREDAISIWNTAVERYNNANTVGRRHP